MAGIYIHIPFCKQACNYCNFYFSTSEGNKNAFVKALLREMELTQSYLNGETVETIYIGGGTPSRLSGDELRQILDRLNKLYDLSKIQELTIEVNPDDITANVTEELKALRGFGLNRLSIGIQSFFDEDLSYMNRAHTVQHGIECIKRLQDASFDNLTIDLIYGTPTMDDEHWLKNLRTAFSLGVPHFSSYALTVEPKTTLENKIKKGLRLPVNEEQSARQFQILMDQAGANGYEQYEISNFAREGKYAIHNSSYWKGAKYLGLGPSAHSYNGYSRRWNKANNVGYISDIVKGELNYEEEVLTTEQKINERILTGLRTKWGFPLSEINAPHKNEIEISLSKIIADYYTNRDGVIRLTDKGKLFADNISAQLFVDEV